MTARRLTALSIGLAAVYAVLRYHGAKGIPASQFPVYTLNKITAVASLLLLGSALLVHDKSERRTLGELGFAAALLHLLLTLVGLGSPLLDKLRDGEGRFTLAANLALLTGSLAFGVLLSLREAARKVAPQRTRGPSLIPGRGRSLLLLVAAHMLCFSSGWLGVSLWPWGLPPLTLLSFGLCVGFLTARMLRKSKPVPSVASESSVVAVREERPLAPKG